MDRTISRILALVFAAMMASVWVVCGWARSVGADSHEMSSGADVGRVYYKRYCAACHGPDGRGRGEFGGLLKVPPPNLTTIAERRGGSFQSMEIAEIIDGTKTARAHGTADMPVWGERFAEDVPSGRAGVSTGWGWLAVAVGTARARFVHRKSGASGVLR